MRRRCRSENYKDYDRYGGRGITVSPEWDNLEGGFYSFHLWSITNGYCETFSLDRINVDGHYGPDNCRWADKWTQADNREVSKWIEWPEGSGEKHSIRKLAKMHGMTRAVLYQRLYIYDPPCSLHKSLTTPVKNNGQKGKKRKPRFIEGADL